MVSLGLVRVRVSFNTRLVVLHLINLYSTDGATGCYTSAVSIAVVQPAVSLLRNFPIHTAGCLNSNSQ